MPGVVHLFGPQICLSSFDIFCIHTVWQWFELISLTQSKRCIHARFNDRISLHVIEISKISGAHHYFMSHLGCLDTSFHSSPTHDGCAWSESAFKDFIPSHKFFSFAFYNFLQSLFKITLHFFHCFQAFFLHQLFNGRSLFPKILWTLISSHMDVIKREERSYFC